MSKQRLEGDLQQLINNVPHTYYMKLQVNTMAHCKTVADFLYFTKGKNFAIECKQCNGTSFAFSRFTQKEMLTKFHEALDRNRGILLICFWKGSKKKSNYYPICVNHMNWLIEDSSKKSCNEKDLESHRMSYEELSHLEWL